MIRAVANDAEVLLKGFNNTICIWIWFPNRDRGLRQRFDDGGRGDLTDEQWQKLQPLLPPQKAWTAQPAHDHRRIVNGKLLLHGREHLGAISQKFVAEGFGKRMNFVLTSGERHEAVAFPELL